MHARPIRVAARVAGMLPAVVLLAASSLAMVVLPEGTAAAAAKHGAISRGEFVDIAIAAIAVLLLVALTTNILRRRRSQLARQAQRAPVSPAAVLGRVPPGQDAYGHDLFARDVARQPAPGGPAGAGPRGRLQVVPRRPVQPTYGKPADANMISYELERLSVLRDSGTISEKEYSEARARLLG